MGDFPVPGRVPGRVRAMPATHSTANPAIDQKLFGHYHIAVFVRVTIRFQPLGQVRATEIQNYSLFREFSINSTTMPSSAEKQNSLTG